MITKKQIAQENDTFRTTFLPSPAHKIILTESVYNSEYRENIITAVREFNKFTKANDPHGEHDFGKVTVKNTDYFFKIDYYDLGFELGGDPYNEKVGRLITIMEASEY